MADFVGDGMGTTHAMMRSRLIWVVTKMHIEAVDYPVWYTTTTTKAIIFHVYQPNPPCLL